MTSQSATTVRPITAIVVASSNMRVKSGGALEPWCPGRECSAIALPMPTAQATPMPPPTSTPSSSCGTKKAPKIVPKSAFMRSQPNESASTGLQAPEVEAATPGA